jgi:hypothetical protein
VFTTCFVCIVYRSRVLCDFLLQPKNVDLSISVSYQSSIHISCLTCTVSKLYGIFSLFIMVECQFRPLGGIRAGSDVTNRQSDHSFLFVFQQHFPSIWYHVDDRSDFHLAEDGGMSISTAVGRARSEITSPFDSLTPISTGWSLEFSYLSPFKSYSTLSITIENAL